jgi:hypothetical protein
MPPVNVWPVEISAGTCNRRPHLPLHLPLLLRLSKAVGEGVGVGMGKTTATRFFSYESPILTGAGVIGPELKTAQLGSVCAWSQDRL